MKRVAFTMALAVFPPCVFGNEGGKAHRSDHVVVSYSGISEAYARAIAATLEAARAAAAEGGFDMPQTIEITVRLEANGSLRLWNDGDRRITLTLASEKQLLKPSTSRVFQIYGLCHEVGHLAMYRPITDHSFLQPEAAEAWAHYLGSRLVDAVYAKEGKDLWPDPYDYREDGTRRLEAQLDKAKADGSTPPTKAWKELAQILGDKGTAELFGKWGKAKIDRADPGQALRPILLASKQDERLGAWWTAAESVLVLKRPKSDLTAVTARSEDLSGNPMELSHDDGQAAGRRSSAGTGHAVKFDSPGPGWYLTKVMVYGSRYGTARPPAENFRVWLCDKDFKAIREFEFPYSKFERGEPKWVPLDVAATQVPKEFCVCVAFNPTGTKGVGVSHDKESSGHSMTGLPGQAGVQFTQGDWLIRVSLDQAGSGGLRDTPSARPSTQPASQPAGRGRVGTDRVRPLLVHAPLLELHQPAIARLTFRYLTSEPRLVLGSAANGRGTRVALCAEGPGGAQRKELAIDSLQPALPGGEGTTEEFVLNLGKHLAMDRVGKYRLWVEHRARSPGLLWELDLGSEPAELEVGPLPTLSWGEPADGLRGSLRLVWDAGKPKAEIRLQNVGEKPVLVLPFDEGRLNYQQVYGASLNLVLRDADDRTIHQEALDANQNLQRLSQLALVSQPGFPAVELAPREIYKTSLTIEDGSRPTEFLHVLPGLAPGRGQTLGAVYDTTAHVGLARRIVGANVWSGRLAIPGTRVVSASTQPGAQAAAAPADPAALQQRIAGLVEQLADRKPAGGRSDQRGLDV